MSDPIRDAFVLQLAFPMEFGFVLLCKVCRHEVHRDPCQHRLVWWRRWILAFFWRPAGRCGCDYYDADWERAAE